jgi:hypothetical protein
MKITGYLGLLLGISGAIWITIIGLLDINNYGSKSSEYHNGMLISKYGSVFVLIFLFTLWLMIKQHWKLCIIIGFFCTAFSVIGLFSIGPYIIWGSLFIFVYSFIKVLRLRYA